ncbi:MAG: helix-turn-helix transcriptional regulator [Planctomycetota bacterium]
MKRGRFIQAFGDRVRELRLADGISQEELAARADLHRTAVSHIEQATRSSTLETVEKLARALRVQPADLMPRLPARR